MASSYFNQNTNGPLHPRIRSWQAKPWLSSPDLRVELYRPWDGILRRPARLFLKLGEDIQEEVAWELELDQWLVEQKIKAISEDNEAERFGLLMIHALKPIEREFGSDYADEVLRRHVQLGPYADEPEIQAVLPHLRVNVNESDFLTRCNADIQSVLEGFAAKLLAMYGTEEQAERILVLAIASCLGEKFHVKERRMLGWA